MSPGPTASRLLFQMSSWAHLFLPILLQLSQCTTGAGFSLAWSQVVAMTTHPNSRNLTRAFPYTPGQEGVRETEAHSWG